MYHLGLYYPAGPYWHSQVNHDAYVAHYVHPRLRSYNLCRNVRSTPAECRLFRSPRISYFAFTHTDEHLTRPMRLPNLSRIGFALWIADKYMYLYRTCPR